MRPYAGVDYNVDYRVDTNICTMDNSIAESTLNLCRVNFIPLSGTMFLASVNKIEWKPGGEERSPRVPAQRLLAAAPGNTRKKEISSWTYFLHDISIS
jgi:hypothetical protein